jgi:hypothetical protein
MRLTSLALTLLSAAIAVTAQSRTAPIFIQPITSSQPPTLLAEVQFDPTSPSTTEITTYEPPELPTDAKLLRIGIYDPATSRWASSTTVTSVENFSKGYAPHFVVTVDGKGDVLGASVRGVKIDAGHTRDFGPQAVVVVTGTGKQPDLNRPVVLSPEGRKVQPEPEKSFLQKYVFRSWSLVVRGFANVCVQILVGAGYWSYVAYVGWWRRQISIEFMLFQTAKLPLIA